MSTVMHAAQIGAMIEKGSDAFALPGASEPIAALLRCGRASAIQVGYAGYEAGTGAGSGTPLVLVYRDVDGHGPYAFQAHDVHTGQYLASALILADEAAPHPALVSWLADVAHLGGNVAIVLTTPAGVARWRLFLGADRAIGAIHTKD